MNKLKCPKCGSTNIQKQASYAAIKDEGEPTRPSHVVPNECCEKSCGHKWWKED